MGGLTCSLIGLVLAFSWGWGMSSAVEVDDRKIKVGCKTTIVVDSSGGGNFKDIQSAVNSVAQFSHDWTCISIKAGVYRERVYIPFDRQFIYMVGEGMSKTSVVSDGHDPFDETATLISRAENIFVEGISFINSYNYPPGETKMGPASAAKVEGDKTAFYGCGFFGLQDTLWDSSGRHYFKDCTIEGSVDFIFGGGQSIYESCRLTVNAEALKGGEGFITAQGRAAANETSGFVFKHCNITGTGKAYLGRPWRKHARVVFFQTTMDNIIDPRGWDAFNNIGDEVNFLTFEEIGCEGPGANTSGRVKWSNKRRNMTELYHLTTLSYINGGNWITDPVMMLN